MNPSTLVVVHCYADDAYQVRNALPQYLHHECPVLVLSPADSPVRLPGVQCQWAGRRAYTGKRSLQRQQAHLRLLLDHPAEWFLLHDSDSVCLTPGLPAYLYESPETVFFNASETGRFIQAAPVDEQAAALERFPYAFQPPLFFSRSALVRMLAVSEEAMAALPRWALLIDWYFAAMAELAGLETCAFPDGISRPIWAPYEAARVYAIVRTCGVVMLHSVKTKEVLDVLITAHAEYNADPEGTELCASW